MATSDGWRKALKVVSRIGDVATNAPLRDLLREDIQAHRGSWGRPGLHAILVYRVGHWASSGSSSSASRALRLLAKIAHRLVNVLVIRNVYGMEISADAVIGRRVVIGHHQALQIPPFCIIGDETLLRHNVNIGFGGSDESPLDVPHIGRNVQLGSGCCLLGPITVGDGARIGPNCVVIADVPAGATLVAPPPRVFKASPHAPVGRGSTVAEASTPVQAPSR